MLSALFLLPFFPVTYFLLHLTLGIIRKLRWLRELNVLQLKCMQIEKKKTQQFKKTSSI